jgi:hypothetical protein
MGNRLEVDDWGRLVSVREESLEDLKAVADACKFLQSNGLTGDKEMRHLAEFPGYLIEAYCHQKGIAWDEWFQNPVHARIMMNDPDLAHFRVDGRKV